MLIENAASAQGEDEAQAARPAFRFLKIMANSWMEDVRSHNNRLSNLCMQNIHRWIASEDNKFYDAHLSKMLTKLMKIMFGFLVKKLRDLGAEVVFANMQHLILNTRKYSLPEAQSQTRFILEQIGKRIYL